MSRLEECCATCRNCGQVWCRDAEPSPGEGHGVCPACWDPFGAEWRPVLGYELDYDVSNEGQVRRATPGRGARAGHVLKPHITRAGYRQIVLRRDGRSTSRLICQLVCEAFHGPRPQGMVVRHLDGDSRNDTPENLAWGTCLENAQDMRDHGTHFNTLKTHCKNGHPFSPGNTRRREDGGRRCRTCALISSRKSKAARKARSSAVA